MESFGWLVVANLCVLALWSFFITMGRPTRASALQGAATALLGVACVFVGVLWEGIANTNLSPYHHFTYRLGVVSGIAFAVVGAVFFWMAVPAYQVWRRKWTMAWRLAVMAVLMVSMVAGGFILDFFMFPRL